MQPPHNPYQAPTSDLSYEESGEYGLLEDPNRLHAGAAFEWIGQAWQIFKARPLLWIGAFCLYFAFFFVMGILGAIPFVGFLTNILIGIITPMLMAGFYYIAYNIEYEQETSIGDLFIAFQNKFVDFLLFWLWQFLLSIGLMMIAAMIIGIFAAIFGMGFDQLDNISNLFIALLVLVVAAVMLPLIMMSYFAPLLILFHDLTAWEAMKLSLKACLANILPFLLLGVVAIMMLIIGSLPLFLGLIVVIPVLTISIYTSYKQILTNT